VDPEEPARALQRALSPRHNVIVDKGKDHVRRGFYDEVVHQAYAENPGITSGQVNEMWRRILRSFAACPDGGELADGFVAVIRHFSALGYWRGYKNAKRHYATINAVKRRPDGRQEVHLAIAAMLKNDIDISAERVCDQLDEMGLSASFDLKIKGKQKTIQVGPQQQFSWRHVRKEDSLKNMISRMRTRLRNERKAEAWMKLADRVFSSGPMHG
jgi:hypothetical protein